MSHRIGRRNGRCRPGNAGASDRRCRHRRRAAGAGRPAPQWQKASVDWSGSRRDRSAGCRRRPGRAHAPLSGDGGSAVHAALKIRDRHRSRRGLCIDPQATGRTAVCAGGDLLRQDPTAPLRGGRSCLIARVGKEFNPASGGASTPRFVLSAFESRKRRRGMWRRACDRRE